MVHDLKFEVVDYERGNSKPVEEASDLDVTFVKIASLCGSDSRSELLFCMSSNFKFEGALVQVEDDNFKSFTESSKSDLFFFRCGQFIVAFGELDMFLFSSFSLSCDESIDDEE